jgi:periplasmic copper chaperone A
MKRHALPLAAALLLTAVSIVTAYACEMNHASATGIKRPGGEATASVRLAAVGQPAAMQDAAAPVIIGDLQISQAWVRATLPGQPAAGGFLTIENKGQAADRLLSASSPLTPVTQIHEMKMEGDVMKMAELADGLEIPAGGKVELKPGGFHIMFLALDRQVMEDETVKVILSFEKAGKVEIDMPVQPANAKQMELQHGG